MDTENHHDESQGPPLRQQIAVGALVAALVLTLLVGFGVVGVVRHVSYRVFTREVVEQTGVATYTGFLAHITWFLWVVAGTAGLLAAAVLRRRDPSDRRILFFLGTSALTGLLLLDDFVMLHERVWPKLGVPQETLYAVYAVILAALLLRFRRQFVGGGALLAVAAGACWAASLAFDLTAEHWGIPNGAVEDGAKMIGRPCGPRSWFGVALGPWAWNPRMCANPCRPAIAGKRREMRRWACDGATSIPRTRTFQCAGG